VCVLREIEWDYRVEVGVVLELEHFADDEAVGGVEAGLSGSPKGLKNVFHRLLRIRPHQQRQVTPQTALHSPESP
jgi:hypothetical protein